MDGDLSFLFVDRGNRRAVAHKNRARVFTVDSNWRVIYFTNYMLHEQYAERWDRYIIYVY